MRAILLATVALIFGSAGAAAQEVGGNYTVTGDNPNGTTYSGTAEITPSGSGCTIVWQTGGSTSSGICMRAKMMFSAYYRLGDDAGMVIYELQPNGTLIGYWVIPGKQGVGHETLTPR
jgi:hypothetical protein